MSQVVIESEPSPGEVYLAVWEELVAENGGESPLAHCEDDDAVSEA